MQILLPVRGDETPGRTDVAIAALALAAALAPWLVSLVSSLAQPQSYHHFADQRVLWGLPHALNVLSNLPFLLVGLIGLAAVPRTMIFEPAARAARAPWSAMFIGVVLTAPGSACYHLDPSDATLVWDRLPMALGFAGLVAGTLADRAPRLGWPLLVALSTTGIGTVICWSLDGNLVPYLAMQAGYLSIALVATAAIRSPYTRAGWLYAAAALYAGALGAERMDRAIDTLLGGVVSGHTLKHLLAAAAIFVIYLMLRSRRVRGRVLPEGPPGERTIQGPCPGAITAGANPEDPH